MLTKLELYGATMLLIYIFITWMISSMQHGAHHPMPMFQSLLHLYWKLILAFTSLALLLSILNSQKNHLNLFNLYSSLKIRIVTP
jgi:hypothetical protein